MKNGAHRSALAGRCAFDFSPLSLYSHRAMFFPLLYSIKVQAIKTVSFLGIGQACSPPFEGQRETHSSSFPSFKNIKSRPISLDTPLKAGGNKMTNIFNPRSSSVLQVFDEQQKCVNTVVVLTYSQQTKRLERILSLSFCNPKAPELICENKYMPYPPFRVGVGT